MVLFFFLLLLLFIIITFNRLNDAQVVAGGSVSASLMQLPENIKSKADITQFYETRDGFQKADIDFFFYGISPGFFLKIVFPFSFIQRKPFPKWKDCMKKFLETNQS
jgi:hypothetical protein